MKFKTKLILIWLAIFPATLCALGLAHNDRFFIVGNADMKILQAQSVGLTYVQTDEKSFTLEHGLKSGYLSIDIGTDSANQCHFNIHLSHYSSPELTEIDCVGKVILDEFYNVQGHDYLLRLSKTA